MIKYRQGNDSEPSTNDGHNNIQSNNPKHETIEYTYVYSFNMYKAFIHNFHIRDSKRLETSPIKS